MKNVLVLGANFQNKGAQSMLFTTTSEIKKRNADCNIYFATSQKYSNEDDYFFQRIFYSEAARQIALDNNRIYNTLKASVKDCARFILRKNNTYLWSYMGLKNILSNVDLIIDISGYALGEKWPIATQERYLDGIRLAQKYKIPIILMPQSFGPFDYGDDKNYLLEEIAELLTYPDVIFAREKAGFDELTNRFQLKNLQISSDLVLQSKGINKDLVFKKERKVTLPAVVGEERVAIIPNMQCFRHGDEQEILNCYKRIIDMLLCGNKEIYIFRHSAEDWGPCQLIYKMYENDEHVHILKNDFFCFEYDEFVKNFNFIVCSRFHGIVHAYRNSVPAIILGWAIKYSELAAQLSQSEYVFNIVDEQIDYEKLECMTSEMLKKWKIEANSIKRELEKVQKDSCFDCLENY